MDDRLLEVVTKQERNRSQSQINENGSLSRKNYGYSKFLIIIVWLNKNKNPYFPSQRTLKKLLKKEKVCSNNDKHIGENTITWVTRKCSEFQVLQPYNLCKDNR